MSLRRPPAGNGSEGTAASGPPAGTSGTPPASVLLSSQAKDLPRQRRRFLGD
ncbi:MAG: hypothetical protein AVDCRST_MAG59-344 [uncultured Thermomicrobiales bacterium]|uniref:Uncharacterized protein n=1 Tax=uncultured Thermomicrobiales bacterium TaxID=1645740 RepID=A0A6J4TZR3_9BACT|nr:MAG: hypothetical protein AVDCRST_MAG59-344 [uncultured Thermomicrobiales bacterium]